MKSAKSLELISMVMPHEIAGSAVIVVQPTKNVRDKEVRSRSGLTKPATRVSSLAEVSGSYDVIAVDEVHMFEAPEDYQKIVHWLKQGKQLILAGLNLDYRGKLIPVVSKLIELAPETTIQKNSVCELCSSLKGAYTQILLKDKVFSNGLPPVVPEDGTYEYRTVCRRCFLA